MIQMNGKEVQGRPLKIDFDVKQKGKSSYKINLDDDRNRHYNKEPIKFQKSKMIKKERDRQKFQKMKGFRHQ
jgi:hypothetical protein